MKKQFVTTTLAGLALAVLASTASAGTIIDKGDLGKYEREGRFVRPLLAPAYTKDVASSPAAAWNDGQVIVDKGTLGKYERRGTRLYRVMHPAPRGESGGVAAPAGSRGHKHGALRGK